MKKTRIDRLLVERGLVETREKARALIMAGDVLVEDHPVRKAGTGVDPSAAIRLRRSAHPYVSRGGMKLEGALYDLGVDPSGSVCADIGSSTGGFTHCLLMAGADRVYAVDVDTDQLDWRLRNDDRVLPVRGNARYMKADWIPEPTDLATVDVAFISATRILAGLLEIVRPEGRCLILVKPQFELSQEQIGRGGVVTDPALHEKAVTTVVNRARELRMCHLGTSRSAIRGKEGNQEFFVLLKRP